MNLFGRPVLFAAAMAVVLPAMQAWAQSAALTKSYQRGSTLFEAGMYEAATPYFANALALSEQEYGPNSSRTGFILKNLATVYARQRKFAEAEPIYLRALSIFEETFGERNGLVAEVVSDLSIAYVEQEKFIQAEPLLARVLNSLEKEFGADDPRVAVASYNYGFANESLGDIAKAREFYARAMRIWQSQAVPNDARISAVKARISGLQRVRESGGPSLAPYEPKLLPGQAPLQSKPAVAEKKPSAGKGDTREDVTVAARQTGTGWHVQLASFRTSAAANRDYERLKTAFGNELETAGGLRIVKAELPKGVFFRLDVGPFDSRQSARDLCQSVKARGQSCIVVRR